MLDKVVVRGLQFYGYHGVTSAEKEIGHRFTADITLFVDTIEAAIADDITKTVDYAEVAQTVVKMGKTLKFNLVETLSNHIAHTILTQHPNVVKIIVQIEKMLPCLDLTIASVGVEVVRERDQLSEYNHL